MTPEQRAVRELDRVMAKRVSFLDKAGKPVVPVRDCGCEIHDEPHWLHLDRVIRSLNMNLLRKAHGSHGSLALRGFAMEEQARLNDKCVAMRRAGIDKIVYADPDAEEYYTMRREAKGEFDRLIEEERKALASGHLILIQPKSPGAATDSEGGT